jgi:RNA polymerase sigma-70 factor (ECF subfamily)
VTKPDDQRLLNDLRAGRSEACGEVIRGHYQAVYRFLVHMTRDAHEAEDLTQETFAAAWQRIGGFEGRATFATWLHRIAYTKFIDAQRAARRNARLRERLPRMQTLSDDPSDSVAADDESRRLYQALRGLEDQERTLLVLHYLQGLSYREMSSVLDEPTGTLKWRISVALNRLRSLLTDEVPHHVR